MIVDGWAAIIAKMFEVPQSLVQSITPYRRDPRRYKTSFVYCIVPSKVNDVRAVSWALTKGYTQAHLEEWHVQSEKLSEEWS